MPAGRTEVTVSCTVAVLAHFAVVETKSTPVARALLSAAGMRRAGKVY